MSEIETLDGQGIRIPAADLDIAVHNGYVTMLNPATGVWRTLRIRTFKKKGDYFDGARRVALLTGPDNGSDYLDIGFIVRRGPQAGRLVIYPSKRGNFVAGKSQYERLAAMLVNPEHYEGLGVEFRISGICRRCNRRLTVPESIDSGMGPECAKKVA